MRDNTHTRYSVQLTRIQVLQEASVEKVEAVSVICYIASPPKSHRNETEQREAKHSRMESFGATVRPAAATIASHRNVRRRCWFASPKRCSIVGNLLTLLGDVPESVPGGKWLQ